MVIELNCLIRFLLSWKMVCSSCFQTAYISIWGFTVSSAQLRLSQVSSTTACMFAMGYLPHLDLFDVLISF